MKKVILTVLALVFIAVIAFSGYKLWKINADYAEELKLHNLLLEYKPNEKAANDSAEETVNQDVIDLQIKYPDVVGWLSITNTKIDYPFIWYKDNDYYLRRDINGKYALAGTIFMDYRCEKDFSSQNTIIYGHHMKNGSMFGMLNNFNDQIFFDENRSGYVYLPNKKLALEIFAYMVVKPTNQEIYTPVLSENYFDYVRQNARYYRELALTEEDRLVTLSTCAYEFNNARMVLLCRIAK